MARAAATVRAVSGQAVLSQRALNRALLSRQLLLARPELPQEPAGRRAEVIKAIEHLVGLQAQAPFPPYYGLWSRLGGFRPDDLAALITDRGVVRIALMRGTIHLVSARDCLPLRRLVQPVLDRSLRGTFGRQLAGADPAAVAAAGRKLVEAQPMTFSQLGDALAGQWPGHPQAALAQAVRAHVPLVQVPPRAVWGRSGQSLHTSAEHWLDHQAGAGAESPLTLAGLVTRYLGAFGPASAPRPDSGEPAPVRLAAEFDNLLLAHADRSRVVHPENLKRFYTINGIFPGSVLIDGFVAGMWRLARAKGTATLTIELFAAGGPRDEVAEEAGRMLDFCAPEVTREVRFAPIA
jgi:Winged helix DNA-binding domain